MTPPYYQLMASGERAIVLEDGISWESFPKAAERWAKTLGLVIRNRADAVDTRVWACTKDGHEFRLAHDHWFPTISLEPCDAASGAMIPAIGATIDARRG